jgi:hypothetical protein
MSGWNESKLLSASGSTHSPAASAASIALQLWIGHLLENVGHVLKLRRHHCVDWLIALYQLLQTHEIRADNRISNRSAVNETTHSRENLLNPELCALLHVLRLRRVQDVLNRTGSPPARVFGFYVKMTWPPAAFS